MPKSIAKRPKRTKRAKSLRALHKMRMLNQSNNNEGSITTAANLTTSAENDQEWIPVSIYEDSDTSPVPIPMDLTSEQSSYGFDLYHGEGVISSDEYERIMNEPIEVEAIPKSPSIIRGNRIVELGYVLDQTLSLQYKHSQICTLGMLYAKKEKRRMGLISKVILNCTQCARVYEVVTEDPKNTVSNINTGFVWGTLASGGTFTHSEELLACMDIPAMCEKMFYDTENQLGEEWKASLWRSMQAAGAEEKENAIANRQFSSDGTPWITVHVDGSWSKRSYGTNYCDLVTSN